MATATHRLTLEEFEEQYGVGSKTHEYWYGEAIPKAMPTWLHGKVQRIIAALLAEAGFESGCEVELRIVSEAHPKPDIVAFKEEPEGKYPTRPPDVVIEIVSPDDKASNIRDHCQKYEDWGCKEIYIVYPEEQRILLWVKGSEIARPDLAGIPDWKIWEQLHRKSS